MTLVIQGLLTFRKHDTLLPSNMHRKAWKFSRGAARENAMAANVATDIFGIFSCQPSRESLWKVRIRARPREITPGKSSGRADYCKQKHCLLQALRRRHKMFLLVWTCPTRTISRRAHHMWTATSRCPHAILWTFPWSSVLKTDLICPSTMLVQTKNNYYVDFHKDICDSLKDDSH